MPHGNPPTSAQTSTQNVAETAQPATNMPEYAAHQTVMPYSLHTHAGESRL